MVLTSPSWVRCLPQCINLLDFQVSGKHFQLPEGVIFSFIQKTTQGCLLGQPDWPYSTGLPGARLSWSTVPSQRMKLLGNVYLVSMESGWPHEGNSLLPCKDTFLSRGSGVWVTCVAQDGVFGVYETLGEQGAWGSHYQHAYLLWNVLPNLDHFPPLCTSAKVVLCLNLFQHYFCIVLLSREYPVLDFPHNWICLSPSEPNPILLFSIDIFNPLWGTCITSLPFWVIVVPLN